MVCGRENAKGWGPFSHDDFETLDPDTKYPVLRAKDGLVYLSSSSQGMCLKTGVVVTKRQIQNVFIDAHPCIKYANREQRNDIYLVLHSFMNTCDTLPQTITFKKWE